MLPWVKLELYPRIIWADALFLIWGILLYAQWTSRQRPLWKPPWPLPAFGLLLAIWDVALLASGLNAHHFRVYAFETAGYLYLTGLSWLLAYTLSTSSTALKAIMRALIVGLISTLVFGLIGIANAVLLGSFSPIFYNNAHKLIATFEYPNQLSGFLTFLLPVAGAQLLHSRALKARLLYGGIVLVILVEIAASGSRGGMVSALFGLGLILAHAFLKLRLRWIALGGTLMIGFTVAIVYLRSSIWVINRALSALQAVASGEITDPFRLKNWGIALQLFNRFPLTGYGVANVALDFGHETHNTYLAVAAETGAWGLLAFLGLLTFVLFLAWQNVRWVKRAPQWHRWALGLWFGLLVELLNATQHHVLRTRHLWVAFALVVALNAILRREQSRRVGERTA